MDAGIVQKIFTDHFETYRKSHVVDTRQYHAAESIMSCRTPDQGYHIDGCPNGDYHVLLYNSCKHRSCPQCGSIETELWLERRRRQALDCRYFHIVFTMRHDLHPLWRKNRKVFVNLMMRASWHTLQELLLDIRWLGGLPGAIAVFQSWDDEMREHCHIHYIVTAGGLTADNLWVSAKKSFLIPTRVLAAKFRGKFLAYLREGFNHVRPDGKEKADEEKLYPPAGMSVQHCLNLLNRLGRLKWHVDIEPSYEHANGVFKYVGRYIRRGCISRLNLAREQLGQPACEPVAEVPSAQQLLKKMFPDLETLRCPFCGSQLRTVFVCRRGQSSVWRRAA